MAIVLIGSEQSPIDLRNPVRAALGPLDLHWKSGPVEVEHCETILFRDNGYMVVDHIRYVLVKGHMHKPSEHVVNGVRFDMEIHLVHQAEHDERFAVVGIFVKCGRKRSDPLAQLLADDKHERGNFDPSTLLPASKQYDRYAGSLTTPPYTENVIWSVMASPIPATQAQLELIPEHARELWPRNRRYVLRGGGK